MPFYAISPEERNWLDLGEGAGIWYRRLLASEIAEAQQAGTERGLRSNEKIIEELCQRAIVGWEGYYDPVTRADLAYPEHSPSERTARIRRLPFFYQIRVAEAAQAHDLQLRADLGNSVPSSASSSPPDAGPAPASSDASSQNGSPSPAPAVAPAVPPTTSPPRVMRPLGRARIRPTARGSRERCGRPMSSPGTSISSGAHWAATGRRSLHGCQRWSTRRLSPSSWYCVRNMSSGCSAKRLH